MKRILYILTIAVLSLLATPARAQLSRLHFGGYSISSIRPQSFSAVSGSGVVTVTNDTISFSMKNIKGVVYKLGTPLVQGHAEDTFVPRGKSDVHVQGVASLCDGVGIWTLLGCLIGFDINEYTADVSMTVVDEAGNTRQFTESNMSIAAILNNLRARGK